MNVLTEKNEKTRLKMKKKMPIILIINEEIDMPCLIYLLRLYLQGGSRNFKLK